MDNVGSLWTLSTNSDFGVSLNWEKEARSQAPIERNFFSCEQFQISKSKSWLWVIPETRLMNRVPPLQPMLHSQSLNKWIRLAEDTSSGLTSNLERSNPQLYLPVVRRTKCNAPRKCSNESMVFCTLLGMALESTSNPIWEHRVIWLMTKHLS